MKAIITVLGHDKVGIMARTCTYLAENNINILDISQTILQGYFSMIMIVDLQDNVDKFEAIADGLENIGKSIGLEIKLQREDIFNSMHRI